jgi:hypothetical protein
MMHDDDAAALDGGLSEDERRLLQRYFAREPGGSAPDVLDVGAVAAFLRRTRGAGFLPSEGPG